MKIFVLDTNVILHNWECIHQFEENDVIIPISVLEELDTFKKGVETINFNAREFLRYVDGLSADQVFNGGVKLGKGEGKLRIVLEKEKDPIINQNLDMKKHDHRILNIAKSISKENTSKEVVLVSKDTNLRMKARAFGIQAEDLIMDQITLEDLFTTLPKIEGVRADLIDLLYSENGEIQMDLLELSTEEIVANQYLILKNGSSKSALVKFDEDREVFKRVIKESCYNVFPRNAEQIFALEALSNSEISLVGITGKAGTGKTLLALASALSNKSYYRQIFVGRPIVPLSNRDMGYLPGDIPAKIEPFFQSIEDNLSVIEKLNGEENGGEGTKKGGKKTIQKMKDEGKIVMAPLSYIRGRSLINIVFIVDEAQNLTPHEIKTIITRSGEGTKMIFTGDIDQIDHPYLDRKSNGLSYLIERARGQKIFAHVHMVKGERSELANLAAELL